MVKDSSFELEFSADPRKLRMVREQVQSACESFGCDKKTVSDVVIAINEACMNVIQHAYKGDSAGEIKLGIHIAGERLCVEIQDYAEPVDRNAIKPRNLDDVKPGGLGTHFIQEIMDQIEYEHLQDNAGNRLVMSKKLGDGE
ncbi:MAG: ATP-binding protein [Pseudomonadota bacterium]